jgi:hypothetical protein
MQGQGCTPPGRGKLRAAVPAALVQLSTGLMNSGAAAAPAEAQHDRLHYGPTTAGAAAGPARECGHPAHLNTPQHGLSVVEGTGYGGVQAGEATG